jgi:hypothetical protein
MENNNQPSVNPQQPDQSSNIFDAQPQAAPSNFNAVPSTPTTFPQSAQEQLTAQPQVFSQDSTTQPIPISTPIAAAYPANVAPPQSKRKLTGIIIAIIALLVIGGVGAFVLLGSLHKSSNVVSNCTPPAASAVTKTAAIGVYTSFAEGVKQSQQACADSLSSSYFKQQQAQAFPGANGQWVTAKQGGLTSVASRLSSLPATLNAASFTQSSYSQAVAADSTSSTPVQGITLTYPLSGANNIQYHLAISFVLQSGKLVVDDLVLQPASLDTQSSANSGTSSPTNISSTLSAADAATLASANVRTIALKLEVYFNNVSAYPSDINASNFTAQDPNLDQSIFTAPVGTKFVYTPTPSGCTTMAKTCQHFTLSAQSIDSSATIATQQSAN